MRYILVAALFLVSCAAPPPTPTQPPTVAPEPTATPVPPTPTSTPPPTSTPEPSPTPTPTPVPKAALISPVHFSGVPFFAIEVERPDVTIYAPVAGRVVFLYISPPDNYVWMSLQGEQVEVDFYLGKLDTDVQLPVDLSPTDMVALGDPLFTLVGTGPSVLSLDYFWVRDEPSGLRPFQAYGALYSFEGPLELDEASARVLTGDESVQIASLESRPTPTPAPPVSETASFYPYYPYDFTTVPEFGVKLTGPTTFYAPITGGAKVVLLGQEAADWIPEGVRYAWVSVRDNEDTVVRFELGVVGTDVTLLVEDGQSVVQGDPLFRVIGRGYAFTHHYTPEAEFQVIGYWSRPYPAPDLNVVADRSLQERMLTGRTQ